MAAAAPARCVLGRPVQIAALAPLGSVYVSKGAGPGLFCFFIEDAQGERVSCDVHVRNGKVGVLGASAALLHYFGGGTLGRAKLQAALQGAFKAPTRRPRPSKRVLLPTL